MKRLRIVCLLLVNAMIWGSPSPARAQQASTPVELDAAAAAWQGLALSDFIVAGNSILDAANAQLIERYLLAPNESVGALRARCYAAIDAETARRLRETDVAVTALEEEVSYLIDWGWSALTPDEQAALRQQLAGRPSAAQISGDDLKRRFQINEWIVGGQEQSDQAIREWLDARQLSQVSVVDLEWCLGKLTASAASKNRGFSARWTGSIQPPRNGQYTFSLGSPAIDVRVPTLHLKSSAQVRIDGQLAADSAQPSLVAPIALVEGQNATIEVGFNYEHSGDAIVYAHAPSIQVHWKGPNSERKLISADAFAPPEGAGDPPGLLAEYRYSPVEGEAIQVEPRIDRQIDFLWTTGDTILPRNVEYRQRLIDELSARYASEAFLTERLAHLDDPTLLGWAGPAESMTSAQRAALLQAIVEHPELLASLSGVQMKEIYQIFHPGADVEATDMAGSWMQLQGVWEPTFATDFYAANRRTFEALGQHFAFDYSPGMATLEDDYLTYSDGRCCLPVAYTLAYAHACLGQLENWIVDLDARLAEESLTGDERVDWLLARAQAEEIRGDPPQRYGMLPERHHAGSRWLDEASRTAQREPVRLRLYKERLTRAGAANQREAVAELLADAKEQCSGIESQGALARWEEELSQVAQQADDDRTERESLALARHQGELQERFETAKKAKNEQAEIYYQQLLETTASAP